MDAVKMPRCCEARLQASSRVLHHAEDLFTMTLSCGRRDAVALVAEPSDLFAVRIQEQRQALKPVASFGLRSTDVDLHTGCQRAWYVSQQPASGAIF